MTDKWQPSKLYAPGALVVPRTDIANPGGEVTNGSFETGDDTDWTLSANATVDTSYHYGTGNSLRFENTAGYEEGFHDPVPVLPGKSISASAQYQQGAASSGHNAARVSLRWYDSGMVTIRTDGGNIINSGSGSAWKQTSVTATAPAGAAFVAIGYDTTRDRGNQSWISNFKWNYTALPIPAGLVFKAVQPATGYSDNDEPVWPTTTGVQVIDNEVIWEGVIASRVTWEARPILKSGATEPEWPLAAGESVPDNTISWMLMTGRVDDPKCPNSPYVVLDQNKVYAGDDDIVAFSAVNDPLDWHTADNAGYLAFGNGKYGSNPIRAMGLYRSNLMVFNSQSFQLWQIDPDPELNSRLDQGPIGSVFHKAYAPVGNDALFMSAKGIRSVGIAASSTNIAAGDVGLPIDPLVRAAVSRAVEAGIEPKGLYTPTGGQYWLFLPDTENESTEAFVYTLSTTGSVGAWSRYLFPFSLDYFVFDGDTLVIRAGDTVLEYAEFISEDGWEQGYRFDLMPHDGASIDESEDIEATIWFPWLEMGGQLGQDKNLEAIDISGYADNDPTIAFGWDENDITAFTDPFEIPPDTIPDEVIAFELTAPSISVRITYTGGNWKFNALGVYLHGRR